MKKWISFLLTLTLLTGLIGLVGVSQAEDATTITFAADTVLVAVGKTASTKASVAPYAANKKGLTYTTSDPSIATVTNKGKLTGVAQGECQVTATSVYDPTVSKSITVQVILPVKKLTVTAPSKTVSVGQTLQLAVGYEPENASLLAATFTSSKDSVATVTDDGVIAGIKKGTASITVTSADGYAKTAFKVTVEQAPEAIEITPETAAAGVDRKVSLTATVTPKDANDKSVLWTSADESIATVSSKGQVTFTGVGTTQITATCQANPAVSASVPVQGLELAQGIAFDNSTYTVLLNETTQLYVNITPSSTTDQSVTYKMKNAKIATVDENGVVTGLKGGKTVVYATTADGSNKRASATIQVIVPVTGVSYKYQDVRVGVGSRGSFTATITPSSASNKAMTWVSSDESIATVTGTTNRFTVKGRRWGRCKVTGTTEDGGFTVDVYVDVGSLLHAVSITSVSIKDGKPYLTIKNKSNMNITQVTIEMMGYDLSLRPVAMSTQGDVYVLDGSYDRPLAEGESTRHGAFTFYNKSNYSGLAILTVCITGWSTDSGFYDHNGKLQYHYNISESKWEWVTYPADSGLAR